MPQDLYDLSFRLLSILPIRGQLYHNLMPGHSSFRALCRYEDILQETLIIRHNESEILPALIIADDPLGSPLYDFRDLSFSSLSPAENVTLREIPVIGRVAAGTPILAEENVEETLTLPEDIVGHGDVFILRVRGESMIQAGIMNDDYIVVHKQPDANNGEIVVALIEDEATVKRFYKENGHIRLQPENDTMEPIIVPTVMILGKVVSLIRKF